MKSYSSKITLSKNSRGIWSLEPIVGCESGTKNNKRGCYDDCYAASAANRYGYDFTKSVKRYLESEKHENSIVKKINKIDMPFVRLGTNGDPSEDWEHTISILSKIARCEKEIVIITKHWKNLTDEQLSQIGGMDICINTSVSALDNDRVLKNSMHQFERIKPYCNSVLRVVTCEFNKENEEGERLDKIQQELIKNEGFIDTVFRPSKNNKLISDGVIIAKKIKFLKKDMIGSKLNKKTFLGKCAKCPEMCGIGNKK
jgi:hypothetical protein